MAQAADRRVSPLDRRRGPRARLVASVRDPSGPRLFLSQDLCTQGISVLRTEGETLEVRSPLCIEFELPGGGWVRAFARVAYDGPEGRWRRAGLEFVRLDGTQAQAIRLFVNGPTAPALPANAPVPMPAAVPAPSSRRQALADRIARLPLPRSETPSGVADCSARPTREGRF